MNTTLKYVKNVPVWKTVLGIIIAVLCLYLVIFGSIKYIVPIAFSVLLLQTNGTEINLENKTYRKIYSILGLNFGKWQPLPEVEYVSIFATTESTTVWASSATMNVKDAVYIINIFYNTNKKIEVCNLYSKDRAFKTGAHVAFALNAHLLDATENKNFKWMDRDHYISTGEIVYVD